MFSHSWRVAGCSNLADRLPDTLLGMIPITAAEVRDRVTPIPTPQVVRALGSIGVGGSIGVMVSQAPLSCQRSLKSSPKRSSKSSPSEKDWMGDFFGTMGTDPVPAWAGFVDTQDRQRGWLREEDSRASTRFGFATEIPAASG